MQASEMGGAKERTAKNILPEDGAKTAEADASKTQQHCRNGTNSSNLKHDQNPKLPAASPQAQDATA